MRKTVKLEYFRSNIMDNGVMEMHDLTEMFQDLYFRIQGGEVIRYEYNNEIAKIASFNYHEDIQCYHMCFERLRDFNIPVKSSFERESETIELEEDEFIGEEVSLLYDTTNSVFIIQRNRDSLSPTALEVFMRDIHWFFISESSTLELNPLLEENTLNRVLESESVRRLIVRVDDLGQEIDYDDDLSNITNEVNRYEANSLELILSVGREKDSEMETNAARRFIRTIMNRINVSKAQAYVRLDENSNVEKYDLIEHKIHSLITFDFREERSIRPDAVFDRMREIYIGEDNRGMRARIQKM